MHKALSLISGGLDSLLAAKLIMEQGVHVEGINFFTGFTGDNNYFLKRPDKASYSAQWVCDQLGIKLHVIDIVNEFKPVLFKPQYGYGANLNPCLDCKLFMIKQACLWMEQHGFDFLITGEVLGQRPKSQRKDTLPLAAQLTNDRIVRPLSAKLLAPTLPEREGWIKRELLCEFNGRSRKPQIALAARFGFKEFPQPAGGCVLTDEIFCKRLEELLRHNNQDYTLDDLALLRVGRHQRLPSGLKVIIGRDQIENEYLTKFQGKHTLLQSISYPGALVMLVGTPTAEEIRHCASLAAYFSKGRAATSVDVSVQSSGTDEYKLEIAPCKEEETIHYKRSE